MRSLCSVSSLRPWETPGSEEYQREDKFEPILVIDFKNVVLEWEPLILFFGGFEGGLSLLGWNLLTLTGDWAGFIFESFGGDEFE